MIRRLIPVLTAAILCGAPVVAQTQVALGGLSVDSTAPVEVTADSLRVDQPSRSAVFEGNVVIGQGEMRIAAARVDVAYATEGNAISRMQASGGVTFVTATEQAEAQEADYDIDGGKLVLIGDVLLSQLGNVLSADRMVIDLATGAAEMDGRVTTIFGAQN